MPSHQWITPGSDKNLCFGWLITNQPHFRTNQGNVLNYYTNYTASQHSTLQWTKKGKELELETGLAAACWDIFWRGFVIPLTKTEVYGGSLFAHCLVLQAYVGVSSASIIQGGVPVRTCTLTPITPLPSLLYVLLCTFRDQIPYSLKSTYLSTLPLGGGQCT